MKSLLILDTVLILDILDTVIINHVKERKRGTPRAAFVAATLSCERAQGGSAMVLFRLVEMVSQANV